MAMKYKATISFGIFEGDEIKNAMYYIPVESFEVVGGANRSIDLSSADDFSIGTELEQARSLKNIHFFIPPTYKYVTEAALFLIDLNIEKLAPSTSFIIEKYSGSKIIEGFNLKDPAAIIKQRPFIVGKRLLWVQLSLPEAHLYHGTFNPKNGMREKDEEI